MHLFIIIYELALCIWVQGHQVIGVVLVSLAGAGVDKLALPSSDVNGARYVIHVGSPTRDAADVDRRWVGFALGSLESQARAL